MERYSGAVPTFMLRERWILMAEKVKNRTKRLRTSHKGEERRRQILDWLVLGYNNREIAEKLGLSKRGLHWHMSQLFEQFDAVNRTELAVRYVVQREAN